MKKRSRIKLIYARYIVPPIMLIVTLLSMLVSSYRYVINGTPDIAFSSAEVITKIFGASRSVVFASSEQLATDMLFSKTALITIIAFSILFLIAFAVSVYSAWVGLNYCMSDDEEAKEKSRTLFITFVPNRIVFCIFYALSIPITLFPYLLPSLYQKIYNQDIGIQLIGLDALIVACVSLVAVAVMCIVSAQSERELEVDIFKKRKMFEKGEDEYEDEEYSEEPEPEADAAEKNEMIRRILLGWESSEEKEEKENTEKTED